MKVKYLKHVIAILMILFVNGFIIDKISVSITTFFNGSLTFLILCDIILLIFLIIGIILWMKIEKIPLNFKSSKWKWFYLYLFILVALLKLAEMWLKNKFSDLIIPATPIIQTKLPDSVYLKGVGYSQILYFLISVALAPILEEFIFRAYLMNTFFKNNKHHLDVLLSGVLFGVAHMITSYRDPLSFLIYIVYGLFFAGIYKKYKDIRLVILLHSFNNFLVYWQVIWIFIYNYIYWHLLV